MVQAGVAEAFVAWLEVFLGLRDRRGTSAQGVSLDTHPLFYFSEAVAQRWRLGSAHAKFDSLGVLRL